MRRVQRRLSQYDNIPERDVDPYAQDFKYSPSQLRRRLMYGMSFAILTWAIVCAIVLVFLGLIFR